jgi:cobalt-zinc-cadmium efflux system outer membrane protein
MVFSKRINDLPSGTRIAMAEAVIFRAGTLVLLFGFCLSADQASPPGAPVPGGRLTLDEALSLAERYNPLLRAVSAQTAGARAGITTARAYPNPEFSFLAGQQLSRWNGGMPGAPGVLQHYSFSQPIELPSVRKTRIHTAELGRESSEYAMAETRIAVRAAVKQSFYQVLRRRGEVQLAEENLRLIEDLQRRIQVQVNVGEAARLELTRADAEVATARTFARSAQLRLVTATSALRAAISAPLSATIDPQGSLQTPPVLPPLELLREETVAKHPALAQADAEIRRADSRLRHERALRKPQPYLRTEFEEQPDLRFYRFGISLPIPIWNKREGPIAEATAELDRMKAMSDVRRLEITAALERAYGQYEVATQQVASYQDGVLREAEAALQAAEAAYKFGERGIIEVLDAQRVLRSVRSDYLNAQYDLQSALIDLEQLRAVDFGGNTP